MSLDGRRVGVLGVVFFLGLATMPSSEAAAQDRVRPNADPGGSSDALAVGQVLVDRLDFARFQRNIGTLAGFGTRYWNTEGNAEARDWIAEELESYGYDVERHTFLATGRPEGSVEPTHAAVLHLSWSLSGKSVTAAWQPRSNIGSRSYRALRKKRFSAYRRYWTTLFSRSPSKWL